MFMFAIKTIFTILCAGIFSFSLNPVLAQDGDTASGTIAPEKKVVIDEVLKLTGIDAQIEKMWGLTMRNVGTNIGRLAMRDALKKENLSKEEQKAEARDVARRVMSNLEKRFKDTYHDEYMKIYADIYDQCFSLEEIKSLKEFYGSPTGMKSTEEIPVLVKQLVKDLHKKLDPKIRACLKNRLAAMESEADPGSNSDSDSDDKPTE